MAKLMDPENPFLLALQIRVVPGGEHTFYTLRSTYINGDELTPDRLAAMYKGVRDIASIDATNPDHANKGPYNWTPEQYMRGLYIWSAAHYGANMGFRGGNYIQFMPEEGIKMMDKLVRHELAIWAQPVNMGEVTRTAVFAGSAAGQEPVQRPHDDLPACVLPPGRSGPGTGRRGRYTRRSDR